MRDTKFLTLLKKVEFLHTIDRMRLYAVVCRKYNIGPGMAMEPVQLENIHLRMKVAVENRFSDDHDTFSGECAIPCAPRPHVEMVPIVLGIPDMPVAKTHITFSATVCSGRKTCMEKVRVTIASNVLVVQSETKTRIIPFSPGVVR